MEKLGNFDFLMESRSSLGQVDGGKMAQAKTEPEARVRHAFPKETRILMSVICVGSQRTRISSRPAREKNAPSEDGAEIARRA